MRVELKIAAKNSRKNLEEKANSENKSIIHFEKHDGQRARDEERSLEESSVAFIISRFCSLSIFEFWS